MFPSKHANTSGMIACRISWKRFLTTNNKSISSISCSSFLIYSIYSYIASSDLPDKPSSSPKHHSKFNQDAPISKSLSFFFPILPSKTNTRHCSSSISQYSIYPISPLSVSPHADIIREEDPDPPPGPLRQRPNKPVHHQPPPLLLPLQPTHRLAQVWVDPQDYSLRQLQQWVVLLPDQSLDMVYQI